MSENVRAMHFLTIHFVLFQSGVAMAGGFIGAYLLQSGFNLATALVAYAVYLALRSCLRFVALGVIRSVGYAHAMMIGAAVIALQFVPLMHADRPLWLVAWALCVAAGEAIYWPIYHAMNAVLGDSGRRGRQLGLRAIIGTLTSVVAPLAGAALLSRFGPATDFALAAALTALAILPLFRLRGVSVGPVPEGRDVFSGLEIRSFLAFTADGWLAAGLYIAWPMILFAALGSHYDAFGASTAAAGLVGAGAGLVCGRCIDRGQRDRLLVLVSIMLAASVLLRAAASWSPTAAAAACLTGAVVSALYSLVLMSVVYDRAKQSGAAFRFQFMAEAGWDLGAVAGCVTAAAVALVCEATPSLVVLPSLAGIALLYPCVRSARPKLAGGFSPAAGLAA